VVTFKITGFCTALAKKNVQGSKFSIRVLYNDFAAHMTGGFTVRFPAETKDFALLARLSDTPRPSQPMGTVDSFTGRRAAETISCGGQECIHVDGAVFRLSSTGPTSSPGRR
jgi:hypothetical protein